MERLSQRFTLIRKTKLVQLIVIIVFCIALLITCIIKQQALHTLMQDSSIRLILCLFWILLLFILISNINDLIFCQHYSHYERQLKEYMYLDKLTGIPDRKSVDRLYMNYPKLNQIGCCFVVLANLNQINNEYNRETGDKAIVRLGRIMEKAGENIGFIGRNGGNAFLCIIDNCSEERMKLFVSNLQTALKEDSLQPDRPQLDAHYAYTLNSKANIKEFQEILSYTYKKIFNLDQGETDRGQL